MDHNQFDTRAAVILLVLAVFALLLTWLLVGNTPEPLALAQVPQTDTPFATTLPPFVSPRSTPIASRTPQPRPLPRPIEFITNPTEAFVLNKRYPPGGFADATQSAVPIETSRGKQLSRSYFLPRVAQNVNRLWYKGVGKDRQFTTGYAFLSQLDVSWWYDWAHDDNALSQSKYVPMIWCAKLPGELGNSNGNWNPAELTAKVLQNPGRTWLVFNEPDFPPSINYDFPIPVTAFQQCGKTICEMANFATLPPLATPPPNTTPTPTRTFTPTPTRPAGATVTPTPTSVWPCVWPRTAPTPAYYGDLTAKMIRISADRYAQVYRIIKSNDPSAKVFCCGNFFAEDTEWWQSFLDYLRDYHRDIKIDGVAIHAYPWSKSIMDCALVTDPSVISDCLVSALQQFQEDHIAELQQPGTPLVPNAPIWVTEIGYLFGPWSSNPSPAPTLTYGQVTGYLMQPMISWLQNGGTGYQAVAWYVAIDALPETPLETELFMHPTPTLLTTPGWIWANTIPSTVTPTP